MSDLSFDFVATELHPATDVGWSKTKAVFARLGDQAQAWLERESIPVAQRRYRRIIEARYSGQSFEIPVEIDAGASLDDFKAGFAAVHERQYGYDIPGRAVDIVNCRLTAIGEIPKAPQRKLAPQGKRNGTSAAPNPPAPVDHRAVYFGGDAGWTDAAIYQRGDLPSGAVITGPAIIEEMSSTTVLPPDWRARVDAYGNLFMEAEAGDDQ